MRYGMHPVADQPLATMARNSLSLARNEPRIVDWSSERNRWCRTEEWSWGLPIFLLRTEVEHAILVHNSVPAQ